MDVNNMNINQAFREPRFSDEQNQDFDRIITYASANALASIGGMILPEEEFQDLLYKKFKEELIKRLL